MRHLEKLAVAGLLIKAAAADDAKMQIPMHATGAGLLGAFGGPLAAGAYGGVADDDIGSGLLHGAANLGGGAVGGIAGGGVGGVAGGILGLLAEAYAKRNDRNIDISGIPAQAGASIGASLGATGGSLLGGGWASHAMAKRHNKKLRDKGESEEKDDKKEEKDD